MANTRTPTASERTALTALRRRETENCSMRYSDLRRLLPLTPRGASTVIRRMEAALWIVRDHDEMRLTWKGSKAINWPFGQAERI